MINAAIVGLGWWGKTLVESAHGIRLKEDFKALLADPKIDAVVLATPHSMHAGQVIAAAGAGKHVFCEKPFALTRKDAEAAVAAMRKAGPLPIAAPATAEEYLAERRILLQRRLSEVAAEAAARQAGRRAHPLVVSRASSALACAGSKSRVS